jgi:protease I
MANELRNKRVAVLVENGFEQSELVEPKKALEEAGARAEVISPQQGKVKAWNHTGWGIEVQVDRRLDEAKPDEYDALLLPGGRSSSSVTSRRAASPSPRSATGHGRSSKPAP